MSVCIFKSVSGGRDCSSSPSHLKILIDLVLLKWRRWISSYFYPLIHRLIGLACRSFRKRDNFVCSFLRSQTAQKYLFFDHHSHPKFSRFGLCSNREAHLLRHHITKIEQSKYRMSNELWRVVNNHPSVMTPRRVDSTVRRYLLSYTTMKTTITRTTKPNRLNQ